MNIDYKLIGARIQATRKKCGFTQENLAEKLDVTVGYVSQVERGITKISLDLLAAIATCLNCDIGEFVIGTSMGTETYLLTDIGRAYTELSARERRLVLGFIDLLRENGKD